MSSLNFDKIKQYYDKKFWTITMVWNAVNRWITPEEYELITGRKY